MPPKHGQRHQAQNKRLQVTDSSGWTHVVKGCKSTVRSGDLTKHIKALRLHDDVTQDDVAKKYQRYAQIWRQSECCKKILRVLEQDVLSQNHLTVTRCVCLGLGSLSSDGGSSTYELAALISMLETLGMFYSFTGTHFVYFCIYMLMQVYRNKAQHQRGPSTRSRFQQCGYRLLNQSGLQGHFHTVGI